MPESNFHQVLPDVWKRAFPPFEAETRERRLPSSCIRTRSSAAR